MNFFAESLSSIPPSINPTRFAFCGNAQSGVMMTASVNFKCQSLCEILTTKLKLSPEAVHIFVFKVSSSINTTWSIAVSVFMVANGICRKHRKKDTWKIISLHFCFLSDSNMNFCSDLCSLPGPIMHTNNEMKWKDSLRSTKKSPKVGFIIYFFFMATSFFSDTEAFW